MKKTLFYTTTFILLIVAGFFIYQYVSSTRLPPSEQYPVTRVQASDRYMDEIEESSRYLKTVVNSLNAPSISVAIGIKGEVVWSETVGFANLERRIPATPETAYRIGSTSKAVTATAFMLLADQGKIDIDQPVNHLIPPLPASFPKITTRQLLSHTAGFGNYEDFLHAAFYTLCNCVQFNSVDEALTLFIETPLLCEPGEEFRYSTFDVIAASKVIESITHRPFLKFLKKQLMPWVVVANPKN